MSELTERNEEWERLKKSNISYALVTLAAFFITAGALSLFFEEYLRSFTQWIADNFGLQGMCAVVYIADTFVSPIPPDAMLFVVAKSDMRENWLNYVFLLSLCSVAGGNTGYLVGYCLRKLAWVPSLLTNFANKKRSLVEKFGHWVVILGALTPLPFSITCWGAGMVGLNWKYFFVATLFRIPRVFVAYYMLHHSKSVTDYFTSWL